MPRTSTAATQNHICPLCGEHLANDRRDRGFVRHLHRSLSTTLAARAYRMNVCEQAYFERTGRCPFEIGMRDAPSAAGS